MMPVKKDASGRRYVQAEVQVPGTPEEVWQAIATGPGISSWFVRTEVEKGSDGVPVKVRSHFGPGTSMDSLATVTAVVGPLGLSGAVEGQQVESRTGAPRFAGLVERVGPKEYPEMLLRLTEPAPGIAHLFAMPMGGSVYLPVRVYLYGETAPAAVTREEPVWQAWTNQTFPAAGDANVVV
jgi:hypothetical protein